MLLCLFSPAVPAGRPITSTWQHQIRPLSIVEPAGEKHPTRTGRLGPRFGAAAGQRPNSAAAKSRAKTKAIGRDRLGRRYGATPQAGTYVALTRAAIRGHDTVGQPPGWGKSWEPSHYRAMSLQPHGRPWPELQQVWAGLNFPEPCSRSR